MKKNILAYILGTALVLILIVVVVQLSQINSLNVKLDEANEKLSLPPEKETVIEYVESDPEIIKELRGFEEEPVLDLSEKALGYLRAKGGSCAASADDIEIVAKCLQDATVLNFQKPKMKEIDFVDYNPYTETAGELKFENIGDFAVDSALFSLKMNNVVVDSECLQPATIAPGSSCVLNFYEICIKGDKFELFYDSQLLLTRLC